MDIDTIDFTALDRPEIRETLFYPRIDIPTDNSHDPGNRPDLKIPVGDGHHVGARRHGTGKTDPTILFFHGNGEIVSDYDDIAPIYNDLGINFLPVDYRGYGRSSGTPTVTAMMRDCHAVFRFVTALLAKEGFTGPLVVMGRSLGSASACELAARYPGEIDGLIIESGFTSLDNLLQGLIGRFDVPEEELDALNNIHKISSYQNPTLIIHAQYDHIIPPRAGEFLYQAAGALNKSLCMIPGADHNNIFYVGGETYLNAVSALCGYAGA